MDIQQISDERETGRSQRSHPTDSRVITVHAITDQPSHYRIEAMALSAADVVCSLGGLLFDRRCLGWDALVLLDDCADIRPLQIIGADCGDLEAILDLPEHPRPAAIATSVQLYRSDARVGTRVNAAVDSGSTEVVLWGDTDSVGSKPQLIAVTHHISQVATRFKTHALAAAHSQPSPDIAIEKFLTTRATWQPGDAQHPTLNRSTTVRF
ncbi:hypothetical protein [Mycobacterium sp.]|uniref:hypothetical protein n=1 Tax=Mycobacterium sp. TaxID=1785 RepID=UPI003C81D12A